MSSSSSSTSSTTSSTTTYTSPSYPPSYPPPPAHSYATYAPYPPPGNYDMTQSKYSPHYPPPSGSSFPSSSDSSYYPSHPYPYEPSNDRMHHSNNNNNNNMPPNYHNNSYNNTPYPPPYPHHPLATHNNPNNHDRGPTPSYSYLPHSTGYSPYSPAYSHSPANYQHHNNQNNHNNNNNSFPTYPSEHTPSHPPASSSQQPAFSLPQQAAAPSSAMAPHPLPANVDATATCPFIVKPTDVDTSSTSGAFPLSSIDTVLPNPVLTVNEHGVIIKANDLALSLFEYSRADLLNAPVHILLPAPLRNIHALHVSSAFQKMEKKVMGERSPVYGITRTGRELNLAISLLPLEDDGTEKKIICIINDITVSTAIIKRQEHQISNQQIVENLRRMTMNEPNHNMYNSSYTQQNFNPHHNYTPYNQYPPQGQYNHYPASHQYPPSYNQQHSYYPPSQQQHNNNNNTNNSPHYPSQNTANPPSHAHHSSLTYPPAFQYPTPLAHSTSDSFGSSTAPSPPPPLQSSTSLTLSSSASSPSSPASHELHISFLQTSPLLNSQVPGRSYQLNLLREHQLFIDLLSECNKQLRVRFGIASKDHILTLLTKGTRVMHISGHGERNKLILEDFKGGAVSLETDILKQLLIIGGTDLQLVFISTCFSFSAAQSFLAAGVRHIIAVQPSARISDTFAATFAHHFYLSLCCGRTVKESYNKGQAAVVALCSNNASHFQPCCCDHTHKPECAVCSTCHSPACCVQHSSPCHVLVSCCYPNINHEELRKFLLLPENGDHEVSLFPDVPNGPWQDMTPPLPSNNIPIVTSHFTGRANDMYNIIQMILNKRIVTIHGLPGIGKTSVLCSVAHYLKDRKHFAGGILYFNVGKKIKRAFDAEHLQYPPSIINPILPSSFSLSHVLYIALAKLLDIHVPKDIDEQGLFLLVSQNLREKFMLLLIDSDSDRMVELYYKEQVRGFFQSILSHTSHVHICIAANLSSSSSSSVQPRPSSSVSSWGSISGYLSSMYELPALHAYDVALVLYKFLPRTLLERECNVHFPSTADGNELFHTPNHSAFSVFLHHPIHYHLRGNPKLIQLVAESMAHIRLDQVAQVIMVGGKEKDKLMWLEKQDMWKTFADEVKGEIQKVIEMMEELDRWAEGAENSSHVPVTASVTHEITSSTRLSMPPHSHSSSLGSVTASSPSLSSLTPHRDISSHSDPGNEASANSSYEDQSSAISNLSPPVLLVSPNSTHGNTS